MSQQGRVELGEIGRRRVERRGTREPLSADDLRAVIATRAELGEDYEQAIVDSLVERLHDTIDDQVAVAVEESAAVRSAGRGSRWGREGWPAAFLGVGSMILGVGATAIMSGSGDSGDYMGSTGLLYVWGAVVAVNLIFRGRRH